MKKFWELVRRRWPVFVGVAVLAIAALVAIIAVASQPPRQDAPTTSSSEPQPSFDSSEPPTSSEKSDSSEYYPLSSSGSSPVTSEPAPTTSEFAPATSEPAPFTSEPAPETSEPAPSTSETIPATSEPEPLSSEPAPGPSSEEPLSSSDPEPSSSEPAPATYKVRRYKENLLGGYSYFDELEAVGVAGEETNYVAPVLEGFHVAPFEQIVPLEGEENFLDIRYVRNVYELTFDIWDDSLMLIVDGYVAMAAYEEEITIDSELLEPSALFFGWYEGDAVFDANSDFSFQMPARDLVLTGRVTRSDQTRYAVYHHRENSFEPGTFLYPEREVCYGDAGALTTAVPRSAEGVYAGYQARPIMQKNITADGLTAIDVYYDALCFDILIENKTGGGNAYVSEQSVLSGQYVNFICEPDEGYLFLGYYDEKGVLFDKRGNFLYQIGSKSLHLYARFGKGNALYTIKHLYNHEENADSLDFDTYTLYTLEYRAGYIGEMTDAESLYIGQYYGSLPKSWIDQEKITGNLAQTIELTYRWGYFRLEIRETGVPSPKSNRWTNKMGAFVPINATPPKGYELEGIYVNGKLVSEDYYLGGIMPMFNQEIVLSYGEVVVENGVKIIEAYPDRRVVIGATSSHISIPADVTRVRHRAFADCTNVSRLTLPFTGLKADDTGNKVGTMFDWGSASAPYSRIERLDSLERVTILEGCQWINPGSFACCVNLRNVQLASSIQTIGEGAFYHDMSLKTGLVLPASLTAIGKKAFALGIPGSPISLSYPGTKGEFQSNVTLDPEWQDGSISSVVCSDGPIAF